MLPAHLIESSGRGFLPERIRRFATARIKLSRAVLTYSLQQGGCPIAMLQTKQRLERLDRYQSTQSIAVLNHPGMCVASASDGLSSGSRVLSAAHIHAASRG